MSAAVVRRKIYTATAIAPENKRGTRSEMRAGKSKFHNISPFFIYYNKKADRLCAKNISTPIGSFFCCGMLSLDVTDPACDK